MRDSDRTIPGRAAARVHRRVTAIAGRVSRSPWLLAGMLVLLGGPFAHAQYPPARISDINERSGLLMRFAPVQASLPPDPLRDNFYGTRYADRGTVKHPDGIKDQGMYGFGWKSKCTESVYPYFYGSPGANKVEETCAPWPRPLRFFQTVTHPFKPVGSYYQMGSYVPIYDFDAIAPGPGPYPFPFYFNWWKGG